MPARRFRTRLLLVFTIGALSLVLVGAYGAYFYRHLQSDLSKEHQHSDELLLLSRQIELHYTQQNLAWANILLRGEHPDEYHRYLSEFYEHERHTRTQTQLLLEQLPKHERLHSLVKQFLKSLNELRIQYREALQIYISASAKHRATDQFLMAITLQPTEMLMDIQDSIQEYHKNSVQQIKSSARQEEIGVAVIFVGVLVALVLLILWYIDRNYARPMMSAINTARQVAAGNMDKRMHITTGGEFGAFTNAFNTMLEKLDNANKELETTITRLRNEIVQREQVEQELRIEQQALALANSELESFSYSVSHDLRAPLRAIAGFSSILQDDFRDELEGEAQGYLDRIRTATIRMGVLIDELLELSRVNRVEFKSSEIDISGLAQDVIEELKATEPERYVEVNIEPGVVAHGDKQLLHVAFTNLLGNAWKFTRHKTDARIDVGVLKDSNETEYYVRDNGIGFDPKYSKQLFQEFQRLHSDNEFEGTGIGLATVKRIIQRHNGRIWAESEPGQGATFRFTLNTNNNCKNGSGVEQSKSTFSE